MIIECDTHFIPKDAFTYVDESLRGLVPRLACVGGSTSQIAGQAFPAYANMR